MDERKLKQIEAERAKRGYVKPLDPFAKQSLTQRLTEDARQQVQQTQPTGTDESGFFGDLFGGVGRQLYSSGASALSLAGEAANQYFADPVGTSIETALGTATAPVTVAMDVGNWLTDITGLGDSKGMRKVRKYLETPDVDIMKLYDTDKSFFRDASKDLLKVAEEQSSKVADTWGGRIGGGIGSFIPTILTAIATKSPSATMAVGGAMMGGESFMENKDLEMEDKLRQAVPYIAIGGALESLSGVKVAEKLKGAKSKFAKYFRGSEDVEKVVSDVVGNASKPKLADRLTNRFTKAVFKTYDKAFKNFVKDGTIEGATELTQDIILTSQRWDRMSEKEQTEYIDSMPDNAWKTFAVSFLLGGVASVASGTGGRGKQTDAAPVETPATEQSGANTGVQTPIYRTPPANIDTTNMSEEQKADLTARAEAIKSTVEDEIKSLIPDANLAEYAQSIDGYVNASLSGMASLDEITTDIKSNIANLKNDIVTTTLSEEDKAGSNTIPKQPIRMDVAETKETTLVEEVQNAREEIKQIKSKKKLTDADNKRLGELKATIVDAGKLLNQGLATRPKPTKLLTMGRKNITPEVQDFAESEQDAKLAELELGIESKRTEIINLRSELANAKKEGKSAKNIKALETNLAKKTAEVRELAKQRNEYTTNVEQAKKKPRASEPQIIKPIAGTTDLTYSNLNSDKAKLQAELETATKVEEKQRIKAEIAKVESNIRNIEATKLKELGDDVKAFSEWKTKQTTPKQEQAPKVETQQVSAEVIAPGQEQPPVRQEQTPEPRRGKKTTPEEDRRNGYRVELGVKYVRQEHDKSKAGKTGKVVFATREEPVEYEYRVVEAGRTQSSNIGRSPNPMHFIPEAQPKDRNKKDSEEGRGKIVKEPNIDGLGSSYDAYSGAPIVNERLEGVQGNNRIEGLKQGYQERGRSYQYKEQLANEAERFGFTKEEIMGMEEPILVRVIKTSDAKSIVLGQYTRKDIETGGNERLSSSIATRMTQDDKARLSETVFSGDENTLNQAIRENFDGVFDILKKYASSSELANILDSKGNPTSESISDIEELIESFLFNGDKAVRRAFGKMPYHIQRGIHKSLGNILSAEKGKSILKEVQEAIQIIGNFDKAKDNFGSYVNQVDMFTGDTVASAYSDSALNIAETLLGAKNQAEVATKFKKYAYLATDEEATLISEAREGLSKQESINITFGDKRYDVEAKADKAFDEGVKAEGESIKKIIDDFNKEVFGSGELKASILGLENIVPIAKAIGSLIKLGFNRAGIFNVFKKAGVSFNREVKGWIAKKFREYKRKITSFSESENKAKKPKTTKDRLTHKGDLGYIAQKSFKALSSRLYDLDPKLAVMFRKQYQNVLVKTSRRFKKVEEFYLNKNIISKLSEMDSDIAKLNAEYNYWLGREKLDKDGNPVRERKLLELEEKLQKYVPAGKQTITESRLKAFEVIEELARDLTATGNLRRVLPDHFPRRVKDFKGLRDYLENLGRKEQNLPPKDRTSEILEMFTSEFINDKGDKVQAIDERKISTYLRGFTPDGVIFNDKQLKDRKVPFEKLEKVLEDIMPFYEEPHIALHSYITQMTELAELSRFIKPSTKIKGVAMAETDAAPAWLNTGNFDNITSYIVESALQDGSIKTAEQMEELRAIVKARFNPKYFKSVTAKSISQFTAGATLGQLTTAVKNTNDLAMLHYTGYNIKDSGITADDLGVDADTYADILGGEKTWKWVKGALAPMKKVENLTNQGLINASANTAYSTANKMLKGEKLNDREIKVSEYIKTIVGKRDLNKALEGMIKDHEAQLAYNELSAKEKANTKKPDPNYITAEVAFNMLMDVKPIGYLEMPEAYATHPSSRFVYALKSYRLRQLNYLYRESISLMKNKNTFGRGLRNLLRYNASLIGFKIPTTIIVNLMLGADWDKDIEYISDFLSGNVSDGLLSMGYSQSSEVIGINRYNVERFQDNPIEAVSTFLVPSAGVAYGIGKDVASPEKLTKRVPFFGNIVYQNWIKEKKSSRGGRRRELKRRER